MGLVNRVVPLKDLRAETEQWCAGVAQFALSALNLYYGIEEAMEGRNAFVEKRPVDFRKFRR